MNYRKEKIVGIVMGMVIVLFAWGWGKLPINGQQQDYRLAVLTPNELGIISLSGERKLVSEMKIDGSTAVWIPGGWGWYRADRIKRIIDQESKQPELLAKILYYNFGFVADGIITVTNFDDWNNYGVLLSKVGLWRTWQIKTELNQWLVNQTIMKSELKGNQQLETILMRDFSDSTLSQQASLLTIINGSTYQGMADWLSKRLTYQGFTVLGVESSNLTDIKCQVVADKTKQNNLMMTTLINQFGCQKKIMALGSDQIELYIGSKFGEMLKYPSY